MHEMALCENILQVLEEQAVVQDYAAVKTVWLEIGPLAGVELEALRFSFEAVANGTLADQAELVIIETRGEAWCRSCAKRVPIQQRFDACRFAAAMTCRSPAGKSCGSRNWRWSDVQGLRMRT